MPLEIKQGKAPICPRCGNDWYGLDDWHLRLNDNGRKSHQCGFCGVFFSVQVYGSSVTSKLNRPGDDLTPAYHQPREKFRQYVLAGALRHSRGDYADKGAA